ncbi:unnamed protein product [Coffea canephora]|uniref:DH200=94 genomic scaffold, scaffold_8619 n=1 Tax=Coffea canephora TaxID=49390 RepID=A0A068VQH9_COFCA|nr:unnamed protein product [Coffea canephora]
MNQHGRTQPTGDVERGGLAEAGEAESSFDLGLGTWDLLRRWRWRWSLTDAASNGVGDERSEGVDLNQSESVAAGW